MERKTKKIVLIILLSLIGVSTLSGGIYYTWLITPPAPPTTPQEAIDLVKSPRFERLPDSRKKEYLDQTRRLIENMPEEQWHKFFTKMREDPKTRDSMRKAMEIRMNQTAQEYAKATPERRVEMLDEIIDQMEAHRGQMGAGRGGRGGPGGRSGNFTNRINQRAQEGNPQLAGLHREFHQALRARMEERGITPPGRH